MRIILYKWLSALILIVPVTALIVIDLNAQSDSSFTPGGKPFALVFTDVNYSFNKEGESGAFELTRAYLGYEYFFTKTIYSRINIDMADPGIGELQMTAFIKNAFIQYSNSDFSARFGMISVDQFSLQENQWGYRYISKSFQDAYQFGPSADLGAAFEYSPAEIISFDFSVLNGEGYKKVQLDSTFKKTLGITLKPIKGLVLRAYYDIMKDDYAQTSTALFAGYEIKKFKAGLEYNIQKNHEMIKGNDLSGISVYTSIGLAQKFSIFMRYDYLESVTPDKSEEPWNHDNDGQLILAGFDYAPVKGVKIAPTFFGYAPYDNSASFTSRFGLYFELKF
jgi:hypothetical protein